MSNSCLIQTEQLELSIVLTKEVTALGKVFLTIDCKAQFLIYLLLYAIVNYQGVCFSL